MVYWYLPIYQIMRYKNMGIISINKLVTSSFCVMQSNAEYPNLKMPLCFTAESDEAAVGIVAAYNEDMQIT